VQAEQQQQEYQRDKQQQHDQELRRAVSWRATWPHAGRPACAGDRLRCQLALHSLLCAAAAAHPAAHASAHPAGLQAQEQVEQQEQDAAIAARQKAVGGLAARQKAVGGLAALVAEPADLWAAAVQLVKTYTSVSGALGACACCRLSSPWPWLLVAADPRVR
jgi:hypothetical protein